MSTTAPVAVQQSPASARETVADTAVPKPRCTLVLGVIGDVDSVPAGHPAVAAAYQEVLEEAAKAVQGILEAEFRAASLTVKHRYFFCDDQPWLRTIAAGTPEIGLLAAAAVDGWNVAGHPVELTLDAILPLARNCYGTGRSLARLEAARGLQQVMYLNRSSQDAAGARRAAYEMLMQRIDALIVLYDPAVAEATGTNHLIRRVLGMGLPVIAVLARAATGGLVETRIAVYLSPRDRLAEGEGEWSTSEKQPWRKRVLSLVHQAVGVPHHAAVDDAKWRGKRQRLLDTAVMRLRLYYGEATLPWICRLGAGNAKRVKAVWDRTIGIGKRFAHPYQWRIDREEEHAKREPTGTDAVSVLGVHPYYMRASSMSGGYMRAYRALFVLAFVLAAVAVSLAVAVLAVTLILHGHPPMWLVIPLASGKIAAILAMLVIEHVGRHHRVQEVGSDTRYLAELLRPLEWLAPAGASVPAVSLPAHHASVDPRHQWTQWLFRAICRNLPLMVCERCDDGSRDVAMDSALARRTLEAARTKWVEGQITYHWDTAERMHALESGLENLAKRLLWCVLAYAAIALGAEIIHHVYVIEWARVTAIVVGSLAAAIPAFIAAIGGIMFQSEAKRLRMQSEAMYEGLVQQSEGLKHDIEVLDQETVDGPGWAAAKRLRQIARMMVEETGGWKALYEVHDVRAG